MSLAERIRRSISLYGDDVVVTVKGEAKSGKAFIEPLRYKNRMYIGGKRIEPGFYDGGYYLYIGQYDIPLNDIQNTVISRGEEKFYIKRSEMYKSGNENLYVWAIVVVNTEKEDAEYDQY